VIATPKRRVHNLKIFLVIIAILILIGFIFIYSSSSVFALEKFGSAHYFAQRQLIGLVLGLVGLIVLYLIPTNVLQKISPLLLFTALGLTMLTKVPALAVHIHGSSRWLKLPGIPAFQPSEFLKLALLLYTAYFLTKHDARRATFLKSYLPLLCILGMTSAVLLAQPDFGLTLTLCATVFIMLFIAHYPLVYLLSTIMLLIPAAITLVMLKPYRFQRIMTFLNPWADPKGSGFQIIQSLIAVGSGGFWGVGISHSRQKFFYLPMQHTDFIFSIIAEETGFFGALCLIGLFIAFAYFGIKLALELHDQFAFLATIGFVTITTIQALINLAVTTGLVPTKGVALPFISYGSTGLTCSIAILGFIIKAVYTESRTTKN
jgi:cell division protein FtsW